MVAPIQAAAQVAPNRGPGYTRAELAPGVWAFVFDNPLGDRANVDGSSLVIINDADVVVVDAQWSPNSARHVLAEIRKLTRKPVRYVITTHWHGDHWFGNQVYQEAFPGVEFIAHPNTLADLETKELPDLEPTRAITLPRMIQELEGRAAKAVRRDGKPYARDDSLQVANQIAALRWAIPAMKEIRPVKPTLLVTDSLTLRRGDRTIVIRYLGRGNTRGDLSVWLPTERILATGDLLVNPVPYSFGSYLSEWIRTLGRLRELPVAAIVPGHGEIQRDWAYLDLVVEALSSTLAQATDAVAKGLDLEATRKAVDLSGFRRRFAGDHEAKGRAFDAFFSAPAVERAWLEARGELDRKAP
jgi:cyclase